MTLLPYQMNKAPSLSPSPPGGKKEKSLKKREENSSLSLSLSYDAPESPPKQSRRIIIREEFVDLTSHLPIASLLEQMLRCCREGTDFDLYREEEKVNPPKSPSSLQYGWFYKSSRDLIEGALLRVTLSTFRRYMGFLKSRGWIQTRRNPENKLDSKVHYRVNLRKLAIDLQKRGHCLPSFEIQGNCSETEKDISARSNLYKMGSALAGNGHSKERGL